ncbi:MAG: helix-turn-helix domain-containing protein [Zavarzinia sp.]|nr:helix-turn-helix domain-containing protein [Zavarzinia sp.]
MSMTDSDIDQRLGIRIKALRAAAGLTLDALAEAGGVSRAMLSRIERGESSPTAQLLGRICGGLGITLSTLFAATEKTASPLSRRADQTVWRDPATGYVRRNISPAGTGSPVEIVEVEFPPGAVVGFDNQRFTGIDQHIHVLDGRLDFSLGDENFVLAAGDCLHMRLDRPTLFRNTSGAPVRYLVTLGQGGPRP